MNILQRIQKAIIYKRRKDMKKFDDMVYRKEWVWHFAKFDKDQLYEMNMGVLCGLTLDQINLYADPEMNYLCMRLIKESFQELMPIEQVAVFADRKFSYSQMNMLKEAFKKGLTIEQVKSIANPEFTYEQMRNKLNELLKTI